MLRNCNITYKIIRLQVNYKVFIEVLKFIVFYENMHNKSSMVLM